MDISLILPEFIPDKVGFTSNEINPILLQIRFQYNKARLASHFVRKSVTGTYYYLPLSNIDEHLFNCRVHKNVHSLKIYEHIIIFKSLYYFFLNSQKINTKCIFAKLSYYH